MKLIDIPLSQANEFIIANHRHHGMRIGHKFSLAALNEFSEVCGVAIVGRPSARRLDRNGTLEVTRLCTDGTPNACSFLYAACVRRAKKMECKRIITYILKQEPGTSLRAAGWHATKETPGKPWGNAKRPRTDKHPLGPKIRYEKFW